MVLFMNVTFRAFSVTICAAALLAGSQLANWATLNSNLQSWLVFGRLWKLPMTEDSKKVNKDGAAEEKRKKMPWEGWLTFISV